MISALHQGDYQMTGRDQGREEAELRTYGNVHFRFFGYVQCDLCERLHILEGWAFERSQTVRSGIFSSAGTLDRTSQRD